MNVPVILNGNKTILEAPADETLMSVLRRIGCASVKCGCGQGMCGSCTVLLNDSPVATCKIPLGIIQNADIVTLEYFERTKEYSIMKTHVDIGGEILKDFTSIKNVADGAKYHHERYDGKGYNTGLKGEEIPLTARIIGLADAFDAMTSKRVYRPAMKMDKVIQELKDGSGTQFDPKLVEILLELLNSGRLDVSEIKKQSEEIEE